MVKRVIIKGSILLVIIFVVVTIIGLLTPRVASWWKNYQAEQYTEQLKRVKLETERAYANDFMGGKTPEETFDLFITALKEGNTYKASKYYELSVQPKALVGLQGELAKNGNLDLSIKYFTEVRTKGVKKCNEKGDGCTFRFIDPKDGVSEIVDVVMNQSSRVWKLQK